MFRARFPGRRRPLDPCSPTAGTTAPRRPYPRASSSPAACFLARGRGSGSGRVGPRGGAGSAVPRDTPAAGDLLRGGPGRARREWTRGPVWRRGDRAGVGREGVLGAGGTRPEWTTGGSDVRCPGAQGGSEQARGRPGSDSVCRGGAGARERRLRRAGGCQSRVRVTRAA